MLVLSRRKGESIVIGNAVLTLLDTGRGRVRIGIEAPPDLAVMRGELVHAAIPHVTDPEAVSSSVTTKPR